jgi:hypothetical protein
LDTFKESVAEYENNIKASKYSKFSYSGSFLKYHRYFILVLVLIMWGIIKTPIITVSISLYFTIATVIKVTDSVFAVMANWGVIRRKGVVPAIFQMGGKVIAALADNAKPVSDTIVSIGYPGKGFLAAAATLVGAVTAGNEYLHFVHKSKHSLAMETMLLHDNELKGPEYWHNVYVLHKNALKFPLNVVDRLVFDGTHQLPLGELTPGKTLREELAKIAAEDPDFAKIASGEQKINATVNALIKSGKK